MDCDCGLFKPSAPADRICLALQLPGHRLLLALLVFAVVRAIQHHGAADEAVPIGAVLDDEMKIQYLFEIMLYRL